MFSYKTIDMHEGLKYLGSILKPEIYGKKARGGWMKRLRIKFIIGATYGFQGEEA